MMIEVPMNVTRFKVYPEDSMVEVWGYVGDYEVMTCISTSEAVEKDLITQEQALQKPVCSLCGKRGNLRAVEDNGPQRYCAKCHKGWKVAQK